MTPAERQIEAMQSLSQSVAAWLAGMTSRNLRSTDCPRNDDQSYDARAVIEWLVDRQSTPVSDDVLLAAPTDSPALERYRMARAKMAEQDLDVRKGELVRVSELKEVLSRWANRLRRCGDLLARKFGNDANGILTDAIADCHVISSNFCDENERKEKNNAARK